MDNDDMNISEDEESTMLKKEPKNSVKHNWPSIRTLLIFIVMISLLVVVGYLMRYGGEDIYYDGDAYCFSGVDVNKGDTVKIAVISQSEPLTIFGTNEDDVHGDRLEYERGRKYSLDPNERRIIEYTASRDGTWGIAVTANYRTNYRVQILDPLSVDNIQYSFVSVYFIIIIATILIIVDYYFYWSQTRRL